MVKVRFHREVPDEKIKFAVTAARYNEKWIFCKHRARNTLELPGGHREQGEEVSTAARRELYEETGAQKFELRPVCPYSVEGPTGANPSGEESFGMLYLAEIAELGELPPMEIERIEFLDGLPDQMTYPGIIPSLMAKAESMLTQ